MKDFIFITEDEFREAYGRVDSHSTNEGILEHVNRFLNEKAQKAWCTVASDSLNKGYMDEFNRQGLQPDNTHEAFVFLREIKEELDVTDCDHKITLDMPEGDDDIVMAFTVFCPRCRKELS